MRLCYAAKVNTNVVTEWTKLVHVDPRRSKIYANLIIECPKANVLV